MSEHTVDEQPAKYLTDVHAIGQQALAQPRARRGSTRAGYT